MEKNWFDDLLRVLGRDPSRHDPADELRNKLNVWRERWSDGLSTSGSAKSFVAPPSYTEPCFTAQSMDPAPTIEPYVATPPRRRKGRK